MAKGNMILTLVASTKKWSSGLKKASKDAITFGGVVKSVVAGVSTAFLGIAGAILLFLPNFIKMGEEARRSERRLANVAESMGLFKKNTEEVTTALSKYAEQLSFTTGVDDELIRNAEAILLTFKQVAKTADDGVGNAFERATQAALDLAAAGFGDVEQNAKQLGKALQDPIKGITALTRSGVTFTQKEKDKIKALVESGKLLEAQNIILAAVEQQVGGTAEATASATDKMAARFESIVETMSVALLPAVDDLAQAFADWLDSKDGKKAVNDLTDAFIDFGKWITSPEGRKSIEDLIGSIEFLITTMVNLVDWIKDAVKWWKRLLGIADEYDKSYGGSYAGGTSTYPGAPHTNPDIPTPKQGGSAPKGALNPVVVNVTGITPSATIGRTVMQSVKDAQRLGMR